MPLFSPSFSRKRNAGKLAAKRAQKIIDLSDGGSAICGPSNLQLRPSAYSDPASELLATPSCN